MQLLKIINPKNTNKRDVSSWLHRRAVRAVVFDSEGRIGLLHVKKKHYYKLPGGGVKKGENIKATLDRECKEELGVDVEVIKEIGSIIEYRSEFKVHQVSYCFLAKIKSQKKLPNFTEREKLLGFEIVWVKPKKALRLLNLKQTSDYEGKFIEERDFCFLNNAF